MTEISLGELSPDASRSAERLTASALAAVDGVRHEIERTHSAVVALGTENEVLKRQLEAIKSQNVALKAQNDGLVNENQAALTEICQLQELAARNREQLDQQRDNSRVLHEHIRDLHADLDGRNLPELALKMAMTVTGAEVGLFTEADGDGALARVGFDNLSDFLVQAVFDYSRHTAQSKQPTVENEADKLPDGAGLVNLAALPFAVKGEMRGVLLLANKRSGPFTEAECQILLAIGQHAGLSMENARLHRALRDAYASTVAVLADAIEAKDAYTRGHCEGVSRVAVEVGRRLGMDDAALENVRYAALLHDVGKIGIPDGILLKPGKLITEEFSIIQKHAAIGRDLVSRVPALSHLGDVILHHHERFDGSGYPDGLDGKNIPLVSRIIGIVDAFDAMTTPRPYREPVGNDVALEEMRRCAGTQFDPEIVQIATEILLETDHEDF